MRSISAISLILFVLVTTTCASPIAYFITQEVENMRAKGMSESLISARLSPLHPTPAYVDISASARANRDTSGDISPGSLPVPEMLPHRRKDSAGSLSILGSLRRHLPRVSSWWSPAESAAEWGYDAEELGAYEGREDEVKRPRGMRFWGQH